MAYAATTFACRSDVRSFPLLELNDTHLEQLSSVLLEVRCRHQLPQQPRCRHPNADNEVRGTLSVDMTGIGQGSDEAHCEDGEQWTDVVAE